ncbi:MAG: hypothetical protein LBL55_11420 [Propionibacteriaceae bacterium]|nr:hypothetical protein [Propionibacteriaceae bacterium]
MSADPRRALGALAEALRAAAARVERAAPELVAETVDLVYDEARSTAPQTADRPTAPIGRSFAGGIGLVEADGSYGRLEWGTSRRPARPFLGPAADLGQRFLRAELTELAGVL